MKLHEIWPDFLAGKKIRCKSWETQNWFFILIDGCIVTQDGDKISNLVAPAILATDWELYEEPAPEPTEKTRGQELYEIYGSVFGSTGIAWNDRDASYRDRYEIIAQRLEPKVLYRHWLTMQKMAATTSTEQLIKTCYEKGWGWEDAATTIEAEVLRRHRGSLPKTEGKTAGQVLREIHGANPNLVWEDLNDKIKDRYENSAAAFLSAYQLLPEPEPKAESAKDFIAKTFKEYCFMQGMDTRICQIGIKSGVISGVAPTDELAAQDALAGIYEYLNSRD